MYIFDIKACMDAGIPFHSKIGFLELPNPIVEYLMIVSSINAFYTKIQTQSDS